MALVSAMVLARNEEKNIEYCLETLLWCDEIVVVNMDSSDRTAEIAKKYTDKIFFHEIITAFDIAKKFGVEKAAGDWILLVDADEMIQHSLAKRLRSIAEENSADIVEIPFKHFILGEWTQYTGWGGTPLPRFFRQGKINFTETIHGYMHLVEGAKVIRLETREDNCIYHFAYDDSTHFVEKLNRYTSIEASHLYQKAAPFSPWRLIMTALREIFQRYIIGKGYREGVRGFSLSLMMGFYRALTYIKLWEMRQNESGPVKKRYDKIRQKLLSAWKCS